MALVSGEPMVFCMTGLHTITAGSGIEALPDGGLPCDLAHSEPPRMGHVVTNQEWTKEQRAVYGVRVYANPNWSLGELSDVSISRRACVLADSGSLNTKLVGGAPFVGALRRDGAFLHTPINSTVIPPSCCEVPRPDGAATEGCPDAGSTNMWAETF